jgi:hypothetical protein
MALESSTAVAIFSIPPHLLFSLQWYRLRSESSSLAMQIKNMPTATICGEWGKRLNYWMPPVVSQTLGGGCRIHKNDISR